MREFEGAIDGAGLLFPKGTFGMTHLYETAQGTPQNPTVPSEMHSFQPAYRKTRPAATVLARQDHLNHSITLRGTAVPTIETEDMLSLSYLEIIKYVTLPVKTWSFCDLRISQTGLHLYENEDNTAAR